MDLKSNISSCSYVRFRVEATWCCVVNSTFSADKRAYGYLTTDGRR